MIDSRNVLTIATGKQLYLDMALNLARSFIWWHPDTDINFLLATDQPAHIPVNIKSKITIINIKPGEFGHGFSPKLYLDKLAPQGQTLFIDSDCLIYADLNPVFEQFKGHKVSVIGNYISKGEWFGDMVSICKKFNISRMPKFNGGIYYLERGEVAALVYENARKLEAQYDDIGFVRLRGRPNDEVLMALAMQLHNQTPLIDDGNIMSDLQACRGEYQINAITGTRLLTNPPSPSPLHQAWYPFKHVSPMVVHFLGYYTQHYPYQMDAYRLKIALNNQLNAITVIWGLFTIQYPRQVKILTKNLFRPIYHLLFGIRKIQQSQRI